MSGLKRIMGLDEADGPNSRNRRMHRLLRMDLFIEIACKKDGGCSAANAASAATVFSHFHPSVLAAGE